MPARPFPPAMVRFLNHTIHGHVQRGLFHIFESLDLRLQRIVSDSNHDGAIAGAGDFGVGKKDHGVGDATESHGQGRVVRETELVADEVEAIKVDEGWIFVLQEAAYCRRESAGEVSVGVGCVDGRAGGEWGGHGGIGDIGEEEKGEEPDDGG